MKLSRRDFLKLCGASAAVVGVGARFAPAPLKLGPGAAPISPSSDATGLLIDTTKCIGCKACQLECKKVHNLPTNDRPMGLNSQTLTFVDMKNVSDDPNRPVIQPIKRQCMHCNHPSCVSACTVGALQKLPNGPVVYDENRCIGCRYCMYACPFSIPTFDWDKQLSLIHKCDQCIERQKVGLAPACSTVCPTGAITFGKRDELLTIAHSRIAGDKTKYLDHVYGEKEVGGTSMLYLAAVNFQSLGLPSLPSEAPAEMSEEIMHMTPVIAGAMASALTVVYFISRRLNPARPEDDEHDTHGGE